MLLVGLWFPHPSLSGHVNPPASQVIKETAKFSLHLLLNAHLVLPYRGKPMHLHILACVHAMQEFSMHDTLVKLKKSKKRVHDKLLG